MTTPEHDPELRLANLMDEALAKLRAGGELDIAAWQARFPDLAEDLPDLLQTLRDLDTAVEDWKQTATLAGESSGVSSSDEPLPARIGRYDILERLGAGGMGMVYKARDPQLERVVAVKVPHFAPSKPNRETAAQRFLRETRVAARIRHPHICPIYDVGEHEGAPFAVMACIEGSTLEMLLRQEKLDPPRALELVRKMAGALHAVHAQGIVHRDLKPSNVLLDTAGEPLLTDFGLAHSLAETDPLSQPGNVIGTPAYMAPEQAKGEIDRIGPWTDLYSLGVVLYEMLTGRLPFQGPPLSILSKIVNESPPPPSSYRADLDRNLEAIVLKLMARRTEDRYQTAKEVTTALTQWTQGEATITSVKPIPAVATEKKPGPTTVRVDLPEGGSLTVAVDSGAATPPKLKLNVRDRKSKKQGRSLTISICLAVAMLLFLVYSPLINWLLQGGGPTSTLAFVEKAPLGEGPTADLSVVRFEIRNGSVVNRSGWVESKGVRTSPPTPPAPSGFPLMMGDGDHAESYYNLGNALYAKKDLAGAVRHYQKALELNPNYAEAHNNLGVVLYAQKDLAGAIRHYGKALEINPKLAQAHNNLGLALRDQGKLDAANASFQKAIAIHPYLANPYDPLGKTPLLSPSYAYGGGSGSLAAGTTAYLLGDDGNMLRMPLMPIPAFTPEMVYFSAHGTLPIPVRQPAALAMVPPAPLVLEAVGEPLRHEQAVWAVAFSPDGKQALTADHTARLWDVATGKPLGRPLKHQGQIVTVAFSPDGKKIATGSQDKTARVWDLATGLPISPSLQHDGQVLSASFSPDGQCVLTSGSDKTTRLWTVTGKPLVTPLKQEVLATELAFSPDGARILSASFGKPAKLDAGGINSVAKDADDKAVNAVVFSTDRKALVTANRDGTAQVWDMTPRQPIRRQLFRHEVNVSAVAVSPDGRWVATGTTDGHLHLWDAVSGRHLSEAAIGKTPILALSFSPDGQHLLSGDRDGIARFWRVQTQSVPVAAPPGK